MAANGKRGEVAIEIGGETRILRLDFNALCVLEEMHGKSVGELFASEALGFRTIRDAMFVGLRAGGERTATPDRVGAWIGDQPERIPEFAILLRKALLASIGPAPKEGDPLAASSPKAGAPTSTS